MAANTGETPFPLICGLCNEIYQHKDGPLMLPCLHSFCRPCLTKYIKKKEKSTAKKMVCPTCYTRFPLPEDIGIFPVNLRLSRLARSKMYEKQVEGGNVKYQVCDDNPKEATSFCYNCCEFLCVKCNHCHFLSRYFSEDHKILELDTYKKGEFKIHLSPPKCPQHTKQDLDTFCNQCEELICLYCAQTEHQNHEKSSLDDRSEREKAEIQEGMNGVDGSLGIMDQALHQIQEMRDKVKVSAEEATTRIDKACDDLIQAVENRRKILQRKCREIVKGKDNVLLSQMVELERLRKELSFAQLHAKDTIDNHRPEEILSMKKAIQLQLKRAKEIYQQKSMELREDDTINTSLQIEPLLKEIQKLGSFPGVPDHSKCAVKELVGEGKEKRMTVILKDEAGKQIEGVAYFQYALRKVGDDTDGCIPPKVNITQSNENDGTATLWLTPDQPGEYGVTIMVRNRPIANRYKITAGQSRDYEEFQNMQVSYENVGGTCYDVAVHDNGTVYAADHSNHTIKVFRPDGTEGQIGGHDKAGGGLHGPWGITSLDDKIYVTDYGKHMVKMYSTTDGRFIGEFGGNGSGNGQFKNPIGICIDSKGRLLVADHNNKRIHVFTLEGNFINSFPCSIKPYDVAVDTGDNIHAALMSNNHIAVYSPDGRQIETYNLGGKLIAPTGIYIDGEGNRFIVSYAAKKVYIANPTGTLISTRQVENAWGVTVDKNGAIYVAEINNSRVSVY